MTVPAGSTVVQSDAQPAVLFPIPKATPGGIKATLLNVDSAKGLITYIIHIAPGARIPAHYHKDSAEAHYVLEGDFTNAGVLYGPGAFFTHPVGAVHGPHETKNGCKVLTTQTYYVNPKNPDFHVTE